MFRSLMMLAIDANHVIGLRVMKLMLGGRSARREAQLTYQGRPPGSAGEAAEV
jgi:hypothetical protein